ncbi:MAG: hypothetical protein PVI50_06155, partial [Gammaproteobacteria bacterium]
VVLGDVPVNPDDEAVHKSYLLLFGRNRQPCRDVDVDSPPDAITLTGNGLLLAYRSGNPRHGLRP